jgi:hypothetical protein
MGDTVVLQMLCNGRGSPVVEQIFEKLNGGSIAGRRELIQGQ